MRRLFSISWTMENIQFFNFGIILFTKFQKRQPSRLLLGGKKVNKWEIAMRRLFSISWTMLTSIAGCFCEKIAYTERVHQHPQTLKSNFIQLSFALHPKSITYWTFVNYSSVQYNSSSKIPYCISSQELYLSLHTSQHQHPTLLYICIESLMLLNVQAASVKHLSCAWMLAMPLPG